MKQKNELSKDEILARLAAGKTLAEVALDAKISRQRVSVIVGRLNRKPGRRPSK